ncbi:hypothetical protein KP509_08G070900 [Ceratopteris richardii]|uniref:Protein kinase domain-containing protein n=1 Tax=Ceratopteris richardii TaxID=49495 RepID=A0A8T2UDB7_CERRI|nr:hypothetical protein KP509_08G070900 [Ceratopteris richardii]
MNSFHLPRFKGRITPSTIILCFAAVFLTKAMCSTNPIDVEVLTSFLNSVTNPEALSGWGQGDPCDNNWMYVLCSGSRVTQLQLKNAGLKGELPPNLNQLSSLEQIALQGNSLGGPLPSFSGLSALTTAYLGDQLFISIPSDFFKGLTALVTITLQNNPLNSTEGWSLPTDIIGASGLTTLILTRTNLSGPIPDFLGNLTNLQELRMSYNNFVGGIPASFKNLLQLSRLELNNNGGNLSGPIDVVAEMPSLAVLWLHVNEFTGPIPPALGSLVSLQECRLNDNQLVGIVPSTFSSSTSLRILTLKGNQLLGPIPKLPISDPNNYTYTGNKFCQSEVGAPCTTEVSALISFLEYLNYPISLIGSWDGQTSCALKGVGCDSQNRVTSINLAFSQLSGSISPALANLTYLTKLVLNDNNLTGTIPESLTTLNSLMLIDVSNNNIYGPIPAFNTSRVTIKTTGNPNINKAAPPSSPDGKSTSPNAGNTSTAPPDLSPPNSSKKKSSSPVGAVVGVIGGISVFIVAAFIVLAIYRRRNKKFRRVLSPNTAYLKASESGDEADLMKLSANRISSSTVLDVFNISKRTENMQVIEDGNLLISIQLLRSVTNNFSKDNVLGEGGFGVVYKGELDDGTKIAVKRMLASMVTSKGLEEFQAEITVLTKVRHRHLVSLLGYCIEGNERLLVYEYMSLGNLSSHLFDWKNLKVPPLTWERRLKIALDVARGIEYLHGLAHKSFIHRDLKSSNILLGDGYRAKVSDFGLVKLVPEGGKYSVETRLAGTFGYLAPEYAVTGRVTTKVDVFSFGVVLMELLTGRKALDETQSEENVHLVTWFRRQLGNKGSFFQSIDGVIQVKDDISKSILSVAELAGHCTAREPYNRPDMGHVVNVLAPLVEQWKPADDSEVDDGIDLHMTLPQVLQKWQAFEGNSMTISEDMGDCPGTSMISLPSRPAGLAQTFASNDGR